MFVCLNGCVWDVFLFDDEYFDDLTSSHVMFVFKEFNIITISMVLMLGSISSTSKIVTRVTEMTVNTNMKYMLSTYP